ncbi:protein arginine methyltransferase 4A [Actinidia rufa]|uniref:type I protein arginine methyltransferase n=1 Tax=Actinidia rufa TaxID=165716 RepID=A0A7J0EGR7_9ERIC|nr:protein arginine methyltransferase 4A [Actinidia rufa]
MEVAVAGQKQKQQELTIACVSNLSSSSSISSSSSYSPVTARFSFNSGVAELRFFQDFESNEDFRIDLRTSQFQTPLKSTRGLKVVIPVHSSIVHIQKFITLGIKSYSRGITVRFREEEESRAFHSAFDQWKKEGVVQGSCLPNGTLSVGKSKFDDKIEASSAKMYFHYYGQLLHQQNMLQDYVRTGTYYAAVIENRADFVGRVVVDVGAGSGILSLFAAQAGAKHVYAVEASEMAEYARKLIAGNPSLGQRITVIKGKVEEVELLEKADILISEPMGTLLINERMLETYVIARDRFLVPNGKMFPTLGSLKFSLLLVSGQPVVLVIGLSHHNDAGRSSQDSGRGNYGWSAGTDFLTTIHKWIGYRGVEVKDLSGSLYLFIRDSMGTGMDIATTAILFPVTSATPRSFPIIATTLPSTACASTAHLLSHQFIASPPTLSSPPLIHMAPFSDEYLYVEIANKALFWQQQNYYGVDLTPLHDSACKGYFSQPVVDAFDPRVLVAPAISHVINFTSTKEEDLYEIDVPLKFTAAANIRIHGLACWFDVLFNGSTVQRWLTTAPGAPTTHWYQLRCVLPQPLYVMPGQEITGRLHMVAHHAQSYTIYLTLAVKSWGPGAEQGGVLQASSCKFDLKEPYYRMSQPQAYPLAQDQLTHHLINTQDIQIQSQDDDGSDLMQNPSQNSDAEFH